MNLPDTWTVGDETSLGTQFDAFAYNAEDGNDFADNLNVLLSPAGAITPEQAETSGLDEISAAGGADVDVAERVTIAGAESAHLQGTFEQGELVYVVDQYYPTHDDQTFVVTFSFSTDASDADRATIADSVLASWQWD